MAVIAVIAYATGALAQDAQPSATDLAARNIFAELQSPALEVLKKTTRLDMLDYWDADSVFKAVNGLGGRSWLEKVTPSYLKLMVSPVSSYEIKILPTKKGKVIMTVYTVGGDSQAADSQVAFYDTTLKPLDAHKYFTAPDLKDFFDIPKGSLTSMKEIREMIPFSTVEWSASPDNDSLTGKLTVEKYMDTDNWNIVKLFLRPSITMEWKGDKYKYKKQ